MQTLSEIKAILQDAGLNPKKSLGQNFLHDQNMIRKLVEASGVQRGDLVLEVGPGTGALTEALLATGCELISVELDDGLFGMNQLRLGDALTLVHGDALPKGALHPGVNSAIRDREFTLVANLPYQIASPLIVCLSLDTRCLGQHVMIQREVAQRLRASVGTRDYSELTVMVRATSNVNKVATVPPGCFWPQPKVVSELVSIVPRDEVSPERLDALQQLCAVVFRQRRKQLGSVLGRDVPFPASVSPDMRAEQLELAAFFDLAEVWHNHRATQGPED